MIVNHVGILPPFAFQVGQAVVGADIDTINLVAQATQPFNAHCTPDRIMQKIKFPTQKIDVHVDYKLVWTFAALSEEVRGLHF